MNDFRKLERGRDELVLLLQKTDDGDVNPLITFAELKEFEKIIQEAINQVKPLAMQEAENYHEKSFARGNFLFEKRNGSVRYSFKGIQSVEDIEKKLKAEKARIKAAFLAYQKNVLVASQEGEEIEFPSLTYTADTLVVKHFEQK